MSTDFDKELADAINKAKEENQKKFEEMQRHAMAAQEQLMEMQRQAMAAGGMTPEMMQQMQQQMMQHQQQMMGYSMDGSGMDMSAMFGDDSEKEEFIAANPQPEGLSKYLALGSFFVAMRAEPVQTLELMDDAEEYVEETEDSWGIDDRESLLEMIESLLDGRAYNSYNDTYLAIKANNLEDIDEDDLSDYHETIESLREVGISVKDITRCPSIMAWDIERAAYLTRVGAHVGYMSKDEAWEYLKRAAKIAKENFADWIEYAVSIVMGRAVHMGHHENYFWAIEELLVEEPEFLNERPLKNF